MCDLMSTNQALGSSQMVGWPQRCGQRRYTHTRNTYQSQEGQVAAPSPPGGGVWIWYNHLITKWLAGLKQLWYHIRSLSVGVWY